MADTPPDSPCEYCGRPRWWPCLNTRDMEEMAIDGDADCYAALEQLGGGEKGMRYVRLNREARERALAGEIERDA